MRRREFMTVLGGAAIGWPLAAQGQQPAMPVIGYLQSASPNYYAQFTGAVSQGLNEIGYVEGQNVVIERRSAEGHYDRLAALAAGLVDRQIAVILAAGGSDPAKAAKAATSNIPIVFVSAADPVRTGLVASLNRPGGNVTGVSLRRVRARREEARTVARIGAEGVHHRRAHQSELSLSQFATGGSAEGGSSPRLAAHNVVCQH